MGLFFNYDRETGRFSSLDEPTEAEKRAEMAQGLFGSPTRVEGEMYSADVNEQGQEVNQRFTQQAPQLQEGSGLFSGLEPSQIPQMQTIKGMVASPNDEVQKTGTTMESNKSFSYKDSNTDIAS